MRFGNWQSDVCRAYYGNKPSALVVCRTFLRLNGEDFEATQEEKYRTFLALAAGSVSEEALSNWMRERLRKSPF